MERTIDECFFQIKNGANIKQGDTDGGFPITRIETTANDKFNRDRMGYAGITDIGKYEPYVLEDGDLLMSHINSVQYLGRTVLYEKQENETIIHGMNLLRLKARRDIINPAYARYCFFARPFRSQIANITKKSVNQASFAVTDLKKIKIDVPEIEEQNSVVDKLDRIRGIIEHRNKELVQLDNLIKARFVELFGNILTDKNLPLVQLSELADIGSSKRIYANEYVEEGIPFYRSKEIRELGSGLKPSVELFIKPERYDEIKEKYGVPKVGDILIAAIGATIGYSWIVNSDNPFYYKDGNLIILSIKDGVNPIFLNHTMGILIEDFKNKGVAGSAQLALTIEKLEKMMVVNPDVDMQNKFGEFVQQVDKSKIAVQRSLDNTQVLFDSLMQAYFG